jgi:HEAT repeat protein
VVRALGARRHAPAAPRLLALWRELPAGDLRATVAEALVTTGTPEALAALTERLTSEHGTEQSAAVRAVFLLGPERARDRLARYLDDAALATREGASVARATFHALERDAVIGRGGPRLVGEQHHGWLAADPRWIDLALRLLAHDDLGWSALQLLPFAQDPRVLPALLDRLGKDDTDEVCNALRKLGDPGAIPALEARLAKTKRKGEAAKLRALVEELRALAR